jgi:glycolate oxidase subunit GlcD
VASAVERELATVLGRDAVLPGDTPAYLVDATATRGLRGRADAVALPGSAADVAAAVAWCYEHDVAIVPRGGGTGLAGGAVPVDGGVVLALDRLTATRALEPGWWRMQVEAGVRTRDVQRRARENGLLYPVDPGAAEQSHIGGNVATNAGGPHSFKYGTTGAWVTGLEAVLAPGELVALGGPLRKDVAGYDLRNLLVGSEGTLGVVTAVWLRLVPAPDAALPVLAWYADAVSGGQAIEAVLAAGLQPATLDYLDRGALAAAAPAAPVNIPPDAAFLAIAEADGAADEAHALRAELVGVLGDPALGVHAPEAQNEVGELWRWRDGVSIAVTAQRGGKVSEDVVVPAERLAEAIEETVAIGRRHGLEACSWGHAGDGNLHATFLVAPDDAHELAQANRAAADLFDLALRLGGSISGEHGIGLLKAGQLARQWSPRAVALHEEVKRAFDPKGLLNPGKKAPTA